MNSSQPDTPKQSSEDDSLSFVEEAEEVKSESLPTWKIMIADDEEDVHTVTKHVLHDFSFKGRKLQFIDAYSGEEACRLLTHHPETAVILLDVVMEREHAGLDAVKRIRGELDNTLVRIILRTGQPGLAPEQSVIINYDINDYRSKTELTAQKMFSALVAALRSYNDLKSIDTNRRGLIKILEASSHFDLESLRIFVSGTLMMLANLLELGEDDLIFAQQRHEDEPPRIIAASGNYEPFIGDLMADVLNEDTCTAIQDAINRKTTLNTPRYSVHIIPDKNLGDVTVYVKGSRILDQVDLALVKIFCKKVLLAYENGDLLMQSQADQSKSIALLSQVCNPAYPNPATHSRFVGMLSRDIADHLAKQNGNEKLNRRALKQIARAAMLCDIGNHRLPAEIWENTGTLGEEEFVQIQTHPALGASLLNEDMPGSCDNGILELAEAIILSHHERFDGSGYPDHVSGKDIPLAGRIVAVADTYIAMTSQRPYRAAYSHEEAVETITQGSGSLFDPAVVNAFIEVVDNYKQG